MANQYYIPGQPNARSVKFVSDTFDPDITNVQLALELLQHELANLIVGAGAGIDDNNISTMFTWSSNKMVNEFVRKETGKGLSEQNFTQRYKDLLDGLGNYAQDMSFLRSKVHEHANKPLLDGIKQSDIDSWNNKSTFSGDYNDLRGKPNLDNLANYVTVNQLQNVLSRIPTKVSQLTNDGVYVTEDLLEQDNLARDFVQKDWVLDKINQLSTMRMEKVTTLPTEAQLGAGQIPTNIIYLVQNMGALPDEQYYKWINLDGTDNGWERMGTTNDSLNKDDYYTKGQVDKLLYADLINLRNLATQFPGLTNVAQALATLKTDLDAIDTTQYVPRNEFKPVAFSNDYMDLDNKPVLKLSGTPANPIVLSELTVDTTYILDGVCKVLRNSAETPTVLAFGTTVAHSFTNGNQTELYVSTNQMVNGSVRPCMLHATYNTNLIGNPTVETNYLITSDMVIIKGDTRPYIPQNNYDPVNVKYLKDYLDGQGFDGFLKIKGNVAFTPTDPTDGVNKAYVDNQIELRRTKRSSELINDVPFLTERDIADFMTEQEILTAINNSQKLEKRIVQTLPTDADALDNVIYLLEVLKPDGTVDHYDTYQKINGRLLLTGNTDTDLSDYYNKATIDKKIEEATIPLWDAQDNYKVGKIVLKDKVFYRAIANPPTPGTFIETEWDKVGTSEDDVNKLIKKQLYAPDAVDPTIPDENNPLYVPEAEVLTFEKQDIIDWLSYTPDQLANLEKFIDDLQIVLDKVWSSSKTYQEDLQTLKDAKEYTDEELKKYIKSAIKFVEDKADITEEKYVYFFRNRLDPEDKGFFILLNGVVEPLTVDMSKYYTITETDTLLDEKMNKADLINEFVEVADIDVDTVEDNTYSQHAIYQMYEEIKKKAIPVGTISQFAGDTAPEGYLLCDGSEYDKTIYADLYAIIGDKYGTGTTANYFKVPDLRGKVPVGKNGADTDFNTLGKTGGEKAHKLATDEMPNHNHTTVRNGYSIDSNGNYVYSDINRDGAHTHNTLFKVNNSWVPYSTYFVSFNSSSPYHSNKLNGFDFWIPYVRSSSVNGNTINDGNYDDLRLYNGSSYITFSDVDWLNYNGKNMSDSGAHNHTISRTGGSAKHNNLQPYIVMNYIIKY